MTKNILLSGIQPTNQLTLGNYLGAIKNWVRLQDDYRCYFIAVDLHSITVRQKTDDIMTNTLFAAATYLAAGIDPKRSLVFVQSHVPAHAEMAWALTCHTYMGELGRMTQFKDKSDRAGQNIPAGLLTYPVLMAADILLYDTNLVPVGSDQKQHIELTRDLALRANHLYGEDTFTVPEPFIANIGARIMDLQEPSSKMSKSASSENGAVFLSDSPKQIEKKFKRAVTDSGSEISYGDDKPGIKNLIDIQAAICGSSIDEIVHAYEGKMYGHLKVDTAAMVCEELRPLQQKTQEYLNDKGELLNILRQGAIQAQEHAERTKRRFYDKLGFCLK